MREIEKPSPKAIKKAKEIVKKLTENFSDDCFEEVGEVRKQIKILKQSPHQLMLDIGGERFSLSINNHDETVFRSLEDILIVLPQAANSIVITTKKEIKNTR